MSHLDDKQVHTIAKKAWQLARTHGSKRSVPTKRGRQMGYFTSVNGGATKFVRLAAAELGFEVVKEHRSARKMVREYLKKHGNIVSLYQPEGATKYEWTVFIADEWSDEEATTVAVRTVSKAVEHDVNRLSSGESGPVITTTVFDQFVSEPLGEWQAIMLRRLARMGGDYKPGGNFTLRQFLGDELSPDATAPNSSVRALEDRGLVKVKRPNQRRFSCIELTKVGAIVARKLHLAQTSEVAVAYAIRMKGAYETNDHRNKPLPEIVGKAACRPDFSVGDALRSLDEKACVVLTRLNDKAPHSPYIKVEWLPGADMPGVMPDGVTFPDEAAPTGGVVSRSNGRDDHDPDTGTQPVTTADSGPQGTVTGTSDVVAPSPAPVVTEEFAEAFAADVLKMLEGRTTAPVSALANILKTIKNVNDGTQSPLQALVIIERLAEEGMG